jgi:hypothetical protein
LGGGMDGGAVGRPRFRPGNNAAMPPPLFCDIMDARRRSENESEAPATAGMPWIAPGVGTAGVAAAAGAGGIALMRCFSSKNWETGGLFSSVRP